MKSTFFFCLHNEAVSFEKKKQVHRQWPSRKKKNPEPPAAIFLTHTGWAHFYVKKNKNPRRTFDCLLATVF